MLQACASASTHPDVSSLLITWAADAAQQQAQLTSTDSNEPGAAKSPPHPSKAPSGMLHNSGQVHVFPPSCLKFLVQFCTSQDASTRHRALQTVAVTLQSGVVLEDQQLSVLLTLTFHLLTDTAESVSHSCMHLLTALAAPTADMLSRAVTTSLRPPPWQRLVAIQPQQLPFQPDQLARLLQWLSQASSLVVSHPGKASASSSDWLWRLLQDCQSNNTAAKLPM